MINFLLSELVIRPGQGRCVDDRGFHVGRAFDGDGG